MRKTLLLADDSLTVRRVIEQTFADEPVDVVTFGDGAGALARLEGNPPDVLLADIGMPAPDGYELALHVRRTPALAHIPVILLTGAFDPVDHARAREAGCAGVLVKPFDPQMLIARVRQLLEARPPGPGAAGDDATVRNASSEADRLGGQARNLEPSSRDAGSSVSVPPVPTSSAESKAAEVDEYFTRLDRAFAGLQATGDDRRSDPGGAHPPRSAAGATNPPTPSTDERATPRTLGHSGPETTLLGNAQPTASVPPAPAAAPATPSVGIAPTEHGIAQPSAVPTLAGAFAALLAIEQGRPLPPAAAGWAPAPSGDALREIVRRVTEEIAEAVVRELAPAIVSDVAERLVREETARVTATVSHQ